jgi:hypothetical protein
MTFRFSDTFIAGAAPGDVHTTARHQVGTEAFMIDDIYGGAIAVYLQANGAVGYGAFCIENENAPGQATTMVTTNFGQVCVAMATAGLTSGQYGWFQRTGNAIGQAAAGTVAGLVYAQATPAGQAANTVVGNSRVKKAQVKTSVGTPAAGLSYFNIDRPFMDNGAAT